MGPLFLLLTSQSLLRDNLEFGNTWFITLVVPLTPLWPWKFLVSCTHLPVFPLIWCCHSRRWQGLALGIKTSSNVSRNQQMGRNVADLRRVGFQSFSPPKVMTVLPLSGVLTSSLGLLEGQPLFPLENISCRGSALRCMGLLQAQGQSVAVSGSWPQSSASLSGKLNNSSYLLLEALGCTHHLRWQGSGRSRSILLQCWGCLRWAMCVHGKPSSKSMRQNVVCHSCVGLEQL